MKQNIKARNSQFNRDLLILKSRVFTDYNNRSNDYIEYEKVSNIVEQTLKSISYLVQEQDLCLKHLGQFNLSCTNSRMMYNGNCPPSTRKAVLFKFNIMQKLKKLMKKSVRSQKMLAEKLVKEDARQVSN